MGSWHSPGKIYALGHKYLQELLLDPVVVEEKIDGSFFQFGNIGGELKVRSKGAEIILGTQDKLFSMAVETAQRLFSEGKLTPEWTYRGEAVTKPKHNVLAYSRIPVGGVILFDVLQNEEDYLPYAEKKAEADRLGLEIVPMLHGGYGIDTTLIKTLLEATSTLGGQKIEGVVIKNYARFGIDKKALMGKYVSEAFKEVHRGDWKASNPGSKDIIDLLIASYKTPARWNKAILHLRELGQLTDSPKDIPAIIKAVQADTQAEEQDAILSNLWEWAWPKLSRGVVAGLAEHYKSQLLDKQFEGSEAATPLTEASPT